MSSTESNNPIKLWELYFGPPKSEARVSSTLRLWNWAILTILILILLYIISAFWQRSGIVEVQNINIGSKPEKLSVARTELPLISHLYRTGDPILESNVIYPQSSECGISKMSHLEPWDLWPTPSCSPRKSVLGAH